MRAALIVAWALSFVACREVAVENGIDELACLPMPWETLTSATDSPPTINCDSAIDCPPPLTCRKAVATTDHEDGQGICVLATDVINPSLASDFYGVNRFGIAVEINETFGGYQLVFSSLPKRAAYVQCSLYSCPIDRFTLSKAPARCRVKVVPLKLDSTDTLLLPVATHDAVTASPVAEVKLCGRDGITPREAVVPPVTFQTFCLAYSEVSLVGASTIIAVSADVLGDIARTVHVSSCNAGVNEGSSCSLEDRPGVCWGRDCCTSCWRDEDCADVNGGTCHLPVPIADTDGETVPPILGVCYGDGCTGPQQGEGQ
ncbi:MAG: hypothetical protein KC620_13170 [Myxococcales bacterium]|nr:hypothetical protein [Myxococcales bacterium]